MVALMVEGMIVYGLDGYNASNSIRQEVFCEELHYQDIFIKDEYDSAAYHALVYEDGVVVGCGRLMILGNQPLVGRIAIRKDYRHRHYGNLVVRMLVDKGFKLMYHQIFVKAEIEAIEFYKKIGFNLVDISQKAYKVDGVMVKDMYILNGGLVSYCGKN